MPHDSLRESSSEPFLEIEIVTQYLSFRPLLSLREFLAREGNSVVH